MIYECKTTSENFIRDYIQLASIGGLTKVELSFIVELVKLHQEFKESAINEDHLWSLVFSAASRDRIKSILNLSSRSNVDQYIKRIKDKGFIFEKNNGYRIKKIFIPIDNEFGVKFILINS